MEFERDYFIHYYDSDQQLNLHITGLMRYLEDIALLQSEALDIGLKYYESNEVAWVLYKWDITMHKLPVFGQTVRITTEPLGFYRFYAYRIYRIYDSEGNLLISANSIWIFVNTRYRRPCKINEDMYGRYNVNSEEFKYFEIDDIGFNSAAENEKEFMVRQIDIDTNGHVNNIIYVVWALESLPAGFQNDHSISRIRINYKKETHFGSRIKSSSLIIDTAGCLTTTHQISEDDNCMCLLEIEWKKCH